jgi:eukaryotic-like serine/threonine-protein kinase
VNAGAQYGPYQIIRPIGRGAMGDVYLARELQSGREIALKIIQKGSDPEDQDILDAERLGAELQKRLSGLDRRVVAVYSYGDMGTDLFIEMEFIDGDDLSALMTRRQITYSFAVHVARELCEMLENLRTFATVIGSRQFSGVIHGDLKPGNLRIDRQSQVKVLDFGIAKALTHTRKYTANVFGSTAYCSPERIETQNMDTQSELWSVGVLLYQMIAHKLPFEEPTKERLERRIRSPQPPPALPAPCPEPLRRIVFKMLARDPARRYQTPVELIEELTRFQNGQQVMAEAAPPAASFDSDKTVRTTAPASAQGDRTTPSPRPTSTLAPRPTFPPVRPRRSPTLLGCMAVAALAGILCVAYCWQQLNFWDAAGKFKTDLEAEHITNLDQAWAQYESLNKRPHLAVFFWGAKRALKKRLVAAADEIISEYRNSDAPSVFEPQWVQARNDLSRALELDSGDNAIEGRLRLCEAHIARIDSKTLRGPGRQKLLNTAVNKFDQAADLLKHSPDPYLGLANLYIYDLGDVDKAEEALKQAAHDGHPSGKRETGLLADGYLRRADRVVRQSHAFAQMPGEEREYLDRAKQDYLHAEDLYEQAGLFGDAARNRLVAMQAEQRVEQRLFQLESTPVSQ